MTGGGSGIGRAVALRLAAAGARVTIANRSEDAGRAVAAEAGGETRFVATDVADERSVRALFETVGPDVHVLVNSAGVLASTDRAPDIPLEDWEQAFAVNARGTFLTCKHALARMDRGAAIVNVASVAGMVGLPTAPPTRVQGRGDRAARALAVDHVGDGIRVSCVCPGTVDSPWIDRVVAEHGESRDALAARQPLGRLGTPEEIAEAVVSSPPTAGLRHQPALVDAA